MINKDEDKNNDNIKLNNQNSSSASFPSSSYSSSTSTSSSSNNMTNPNPASLVHLLNYTGTKAGMDQSEQEKQLNLTLEATKNSSNYYQHILQYSIESNNKSNNIKSRLSTLTKPVYNNLLLKTEDIVKNLENKRNFRNICCVLDMDMFFAAVEIRDQPWLKDKPVAVGNDQMISTSNYVARKYGVRAAMPGFLGRKLCKDLIFIPINFKKYQKVSNIFQFIISEYDSSYRSLSLDEVYFNLKLSSIIIYDIIFLFFIKNYFKYYMEIRETNNENLEDINKFSFLSSQSSFSLHNTSTTSSYNIIDSFSQNLSGEFSNLNNERICFSNTRENENEEFDEIDNYINQYNSQNYDNNDTINFEELEKKEKETEINNKSFHYKDFLNDEYKGKKNLINILSKKFEEILSEWKINEDNDENNLNFSNLSNIILKYYPLINLNDFLTNIKENSLVNNGFNNIKIENEISTLPFTILLNFVKKLMLKLFIDEEDEEIIDLFSKFKDDFWNYNDEIYKNNEKVEENDLKEEKNVDNQYNHDEIDSDEENSIQNEEIIPDSQNIKEKKKLYLYFQSKIFEKYFSNREELLTILPSTSSHSIHYLRSIGYCILNEMRRRITIRTNGLTCSAGMANNFLLAKICADQKKPNGQYELKPTRDDVISFVNNLPTRKVGGIGKVTEKFLSDLEMHKMVDIKNNLPVIYHVFTPKIAEFLLYSSLGIDHHEVSKDSNANVFLNISDQRKSISTQRTISSKGITDIELIKEKINIYCHNVSRDLVKNKFVCRTVSLSFKDVQFNVFSKSITVKNSIYKGEDLFSLCKQLLNQMLNNSQMIKVRSIGVGVSKLISTSPTSSSSTSSSNSTFLNFFNNIKNNNNSDNKIYIDTKDSKISSSSSSLLNYFNNSSTNNSSNINNDLSINLLKEKEESSTKKNILTFFSNKVDKQNEKDINENSSNIIKEAINLENDNKNNRSINIYNIDDDIEDQNQIKKIKLNPMEKFLNTNSNSNSNSNNNNSSSNNNNSNHGLFSSNNKNIVKSKNKTSFSKFFKQNLSSTSATASTSLIDNYNNIENYSCPICFKNIKGDLIKLNEHIDKCLKN